MSIFLLSISNQRSPGQLMDMDTHNVYLYSVLKRDPHCKITPMLDTFIVE